MSFLQIKRARIASSLISILRSVTGKNATKSEIDGRVASYMNVGINRGLGPSDKAPSVWPLFLANDYKPTSNKDLLGGQDGKDISRAWAAVREDLDCVDETLNENERRYQVSLSLLRNKSQELYGRIRNIILNTAALKSQGETAFFGGSGGSASAGRAGQVWNVQANTQLAYPETTAILLSGGIGALPTNGSGLNSIGGNIVTISLLSSSDINLLYNSYAQEWVNNPISGIAQAWNFTGTQTVLFSNTGNSDISAFEINIGSDTQISQITDIATSKIVPFQTLTASSTAWIYLNTPIPAGNNFQITFNSLNTGTVYGIKAHEFSLSSNSQLIWGPFQNYSNAGVFTVNLNSITQAQQQGALSSWFVSTVSADGPWTSLDINNPIVLLNNSQNRVQLTNPLVDNLTQGYYYYSIASVGSLHGSKVYAGIDQIQVSAFNYNWTSENDPLHTPELSDWENSKGIVRTVPMNSGFVYKGEAGVNQVNNKQGYVSAGTCIGTYQDNQGNLLNYIAVTSNSLGTLGDPVSENNIKYILSTGYNYKFTINLWSANYSSLQSIPVGFFNPGGSHSGDPCPPFSVYLNKSLVYKGSVYFNDYKELSSQPLNFGSDSSSYHTSTDGGNINGQTNSYAPPGAVWPPNCGRMNLNLLPGWNELEVLVYIPALPASGSGVSSIDTNLGMSAALIFGPSLFSDPGTVYETTGISMVQGWKNEWTQLSEFDLRNNSSLGMIETWSWKTDPTNGQITGVLFNHNPNQSETGFLTLDNTFTGNVRNHTLYYLPVSTQSSVIPGQDPLSQNLWVKADLSTSNPKTGVFIESFSLRVN